ncbi:MAG: ATP-dependent zinc metalloprotease FtsH [Planctomycetaceae bacterium]|nr:ATP-dependent zinc metalloprotease FtsH [Planctomycetaceae bacterium]
MLGSWIAIDRARTRSAIPYGFFIEQLEAGNIAAVDIDGYDISGRFVDPPLIPPPTETKAVTIPTIGYGRFVEELREGNVAEAHTDGRELVGKFKKSIRKPAAAPKPTASATGTAAAAAPATTPEAGRDFRVLLGVYAGKDLEDELVRTLGANYSVETSLEKYLVTREPLPGSLGGKPERFNKEFTTILSPLAGDELDQLLRKKLGEHYNAERMTDSGGLMVFYSFGLTLLLIAGMFFIFRRARDQFMGGGFLSGFNKSPAKRYEATGKRTTFADVAGLEGVKNELTEIVEFLKNPQKFQRLGGRIPKGVLLEGPPGTGKTLLAKAVAGEAGVPFFSINGSEFIQMFVGVGAGRVRDMFRTAKEASPCILFIDEIDAVGRVRGTGIGGGQDEREQTLNQILSEMDGFSPNESVIVLAATNRADVLDPALLRPGRFDRRVTVDRPTVKGRIAIFKVHTREVPLADDVDLERLAQGTVGLTGADIRNLVNEAAIWATRQGKDRVDMQDFEYAYDKILMGIKREEVLSPHEKAMTAYHEAGHTILAWMLPGNDRVHKVTIIPRGRAMGVTQLIPEEDKLSYGESELHARLICLMGGRAAEKLVFDEYSVGAENDLKRATQLARRMVANWGMSERLGPIAFRIGEEHPFLGREMSEHNREFSEHTAQVIDEETARILHAASDRAKSLLVEHREKLDQLSRELEQKETLEVKEIEAILGPPAQKAPPSLEHTPLKN